MDINSMSPLDSSMMQVLSGLFVLILLLGLQLVEAGSTRSKNTSTVFMRGLACLTITVVISWVCGYSFTFSPGHYLLGYDSNWFGLHKVSDAAQAHWFLHAAVSSLPSTIIAASMSERSHLTGHLVLATVLASVVYPLPRDCQRPQKSRVRTQVEKYQPESGLRLKIVILRSDSG